MDAQELLRSNLALVERLVRFVCQRAQVVGADVEDFASAVKLALIEDDYAVLRAWEGRSSLATYLTVIIQRMLADDRFRTLGRWRPSAEAKRMGKSGVLLETLLQRDERTLTDAARIVCVSDDTLSLADVKVMAARLPIRSSRMHLVEMDPVVEEQVAGSDQADAGVVQHELRRLSERTSSVVGDAIASLPIRDRSLLRLRFVSKMSIADVSRILQVPQRPLYRRLEEIMAVLRSTLLAAKIDARSAEELIGSAFAALDFGLSNPENGPVVPVSHREGSEQRGIHP